VVSRRDVDAALGDSLLQNRVGLLSLAARLVRHAADHPVQRQCGVMVYPQDIRVEVFAEGDDEATGRCRAILWSDGRRLSIR
jgi:hypothetical protein